MAKELDKFYQDKWREQFFDKFNLIESKHAVELEKVAKKSKREAKIETAKNMLLENIPISSIIKITGLSENTILNLK